MSQMREQSFKAVMRSKEMQRRMARYAHILAYSRDPLMRCLARVAQGQASGLGAILTYEEVQALYKSLGEQVEATLSQEHDRVDTLNDE